MFKFIQKIITVLENTSINFHLWAFSLLCLIIIRVLIENWLGSFSGKNGANFFYHLICNLLFFSTTYFLFAGIIKISLKINLKKIANVLLWGYWIMLFPPILDAIIFKGKDVWSFYYFGGLEELGLGFLTSARIPSSVVG